MLYQITQKTLLDPMHPLIILSPCPRLRGGGRFGLSSPGIG